MVIQARFDGRCSRCHQIIKAGSDVEWDRDSRSVRHVGECPAPVKHDEQPLPDVPDGRYAVTGDDSTTDFYEVSHGKAGTRWDGWTFASLLIGSPGGFREERVRYAALRGLLEKIEAQGIRESAERFGRELGICPCCGSPLTDPESIARGIGPICAEKRGW